jgi:hypothetical protein
VRREHAPALAQEDPPAGEAAAVREVLDRVRTAYERDFPPSRRPALRDQHAKAHGCVEAELIVRDDVPEPLRHGLFRTPARYRAWVRFSPSAPRPRADRRPDAQGVAIKVLGVAGAKVLPGEEDAMTQDFVLANSPVFFCRNAADLALLLRLQDEGRMWRFFVTSPNPLRWRVRELVNLILSTQRPISNPLRERYWSQTPSRLGPRAVKHALEPHRDASLAARGGRLRADRLRRAMIAQLAAGDAAFDFCVQVQDDPLRMPIEDAAVRWRERRSGFRPVATLRIPAQRFAFPERDALAEHLSFTPWHSLPDHQPLGGINRVRREVYEAVSELRHAKNGVPRREPS